MAPFSIEARRRFGKRSSTPWQIERRERVGDAAVLEGHQRERRVLEALEVAGAGAAGAPELAVLRDAAQAQRAAPSARPPR